VVWQNILTSRLTMTSRFVMLVTASVACRDATSPRPVIPLQQRNVAAVEHDRDTPDTGAVRLTHVCDNTFRVRYFGRDTMTITWIVEGTQETGRLLLHPAVRTSRDTAVHRDSVRHHGSHRRGRNTSDSAGSRRRDAYRRDADRRDPWRVRRVTPWDTTFTTVHQGAVQLLYNGTVLQRRTNARRSCTTEIKLVVITERGVMEQHRLHDSTFRVGTVVPYDFRAGPGFENVLVTLDGAPVPAAGTVTMDSTHVFIASADTIVTLNATEQQISTAIRAVLTASDPAVAYQALLAQLRALGDRQDLDTIVTRAEYAAYDPIDDSAAIRRVDDVLAGQLFPLTENSPTVTASAQRMMPRRGKAAPPHPAHTLHPSLSLDAATGTSRDTLEPTTVMYVNGVMTTPAKSAATAVRLERLLEQIPRFKHREFAYSHFYNRNYTTQIGATPSQRLASCFASLRTRMPFLGSRSWALYMQRCLGENATHLIGDIDLVEAATQYVQLLLNMTPTVADVQSLADVVQQLRQHGRHTLLVPHSQGTLITQQALTVLRSTFRFDESRDSVGIAVAPLAAPLSTAWTLPSSRIKPITIYGDIVPDLGGNNWPRIATPTGLALAAEVATLQQRAPGMVVVESYIALRKAYVGIQLHDVNASYLGAPVAPVVRDSVASLYREVAVGDLAIAIAQDQLTIGQGRSLGLYLNVYNQNDMSHLSAPLKGRDIAWRSSDPSVVSIDAGGRVTAKSAGTATIWGRTWGDSSAVVYTVAGVPTVMSGTYSGTWETLDYSQPYVKANASMTLSVSASGVTGSVTWWSGGQPFSAPIVSSTIDAVGLSATLTLQAPDPEAVFLGKRCIGPSSTPATNPLDNVGGGATDCYQVISVHLSGTQLQGSSYGVGPVLSRLWYLQKTS